MVDRRAINTGLEIPIEMRQCLVYHDVSNPDGNFGKEERMQEVVFDPLSFPFISKPVLFAGKAMEFYGLRKGHDFDWIVSPEDFSWLRELQHSIRR